MLTMCAIKKPQKLPNLYRNPGYPKVMRYVQDNSVPHNFLMLSYLTKIYMCNNVNLQLK